jgi:hypothetical protein
MNHMLKTKTLPVKDQSPDETLRERLRQSPVVQEKNAAARQLILKAIPVQEATDPVTEK